ncbi:MAG: hypothetical protein J07HB67_02451 [halophilic archaeon J07HB67]|nr:MAG: hypothetical protein J07HB67_02451 [halophilic archaeon J07HB67]
MTNLADVYEGTVGEPVDRRRLYLGVGLFLAGSLSAVVAIWISATANGSLQAIRDARWLAGVLAGVGVPAVFLGIFAVLPAGRLTRAAAIVGAGVALLGVSLFAHAYPCRWAGAGCAPGDLTLQTAGVYFVGVITTFWCLFVGVANFTSRNDPGGTVELEVTRGGETKTIEVSQSKLDDTTAGGEAELLGDTPGGGVATRPNRTDAQFVDDGGTTSDGGATTDRITGLRDEEFGTDSPGAVDTVGGSGGVDTTDDTRGGGPRDTIDSPGSGGGTQPESPADTYCGSCAHFQYVRTEEGMQPYCGYHDEVMEDMDACEEWTPR